MPLRAAPVATRPFVLISVVLVALSTAVLGCSSPASARARVLPDVLVTFRRAWKPSEVSVAGVVSFPLRRVHVSSALPPADTLPHEPMLAALERDVARGEHGASAKSARRACRRADTCAWERSHVAQALSAWGMVP